MGAAGGDAVIAWRAQTDRGGDFDTVGANRRGPVDLGGQKLVAFAPEKG